MNLIYDSLSQQLYRKAKRYTPTPFIGGYVFQLKDKKKITSVDIVFMPSLPSSIILDYDIAYYDATDTPKWQNILIMDIPCNPNAFNERYFYFTFTAYDGTVYYSEVFEYPQPCENCILKITGLNSPCGTYNYDAFGLDNQISFKNEISIYGEIKRDGFVITNDLSGVYNNNLKAELERKWTIYVQKNIHADLFDVLENVFLSARIFFNDVEFKLKSISIDRQDNYCLIGAVEITDIKDATYYHCGSCEQQTESPCDCDFWKDVSVYSSILTLPNNVKKLDYITLAGVECYDIGSIEIFPSITGYSISQGYGVVQITNLNYTLSTLNFITIVLKTQNCGDVVVQLKYENGVQTYGGVFTSEQCECKFWADYVYDLEIQTAPDPPVNVSNTVFSIYWNDKLYASAGVNPLDGVINYDTGCSDLFGSLGCLLKTITVKDNNGALTVFNSPYIGCKLESSITVPNSGLSEEFKIKVDFITGCTKYYKFLLKYLSLTDAQTIGLGTAATINKQIGTEIPASDF